jgi:uncharacterized protein YjbI with pentapeptide repeats
MAYIVLKNRDEETVLFSGDYADVKAAIEAAVAGDVDLTGIDLCGQNLEGLNCGCGKFDSSDWKGADLRGANLAGSKMRGADFAGANLADVNMGGNLLHGSKWSGAVVSCETNLGGTDWVTPLTK